MANNPVPQFNWEVKSASDFHLEQLKILRAKADRLNEETRATERYVLLASGAIYTFLFAQSPALHTLRSAKFIWWIPPVLALLGGLRSYALGGYITGCDRYVKKAEDALRLPGLVGWEHYWKDDPETQPLHTTVWVAKVVWLVAIVATILIAMIAMLVY
jgi:ABC-type sugar transport system permease subunit